MRKAKPSTITAVTTARWKIPGYTKENRGLDIRTSYEFDRDSHIAAYMVNHGRTLKQAAQHLRLSMTLVGTMIHHVTP